jgi:hypothetical protein
MRVFFLIGIVFAIALGYISNIVKLTQCDFEPSYKAEICRGVGIFIPPVGIIEGYLTIKDGFTVKEEK